MTRETKNITDRLRSLRLSGKVSAFSVTEDKDDSPRVWLSWSGPAEPELNKFLDDYRHVNIVKDPLKEKGYYFFGSELRPGSGLIRVSGGKSEGPGGTLTCLLMSKDGQDIYFAAAGHVLTDFWQDTAGQGSIYSYRKGFPPTGSTRFLGKVLYLPPEVPKPFIDWNGEKPKERCEAQEPSSASSGSEQTVERNDCKKVDLDIGIVKLDGDVEIKQRTTCYGCFGECPPSEECEVWNGMQVVKCGSQETHWTEAVVCNAHSDEVTIYGPKKTRYSFRGQVILRDLFPCEARKAECPSNPVGTPFAVPGDSGTIVVEKETRRPVGMLIAGSLLDGRYVMTPFKAIKECFFDKFRLVMQRA